MKVPYREGTWFAVPLKSGDFAVGVVARAAPRGRVLFCYYFGPARKTIPPLSEVEVLQPAKALCRLHTGDLGLLRGKWPIIGDASSWNRTEWAMPTFIQRDGDGSRAWRITYCDKDPSKEIQRVPEPIGSTLETDGLDGAESVEKWLTHLLANAAQNWEQ